MSGLFGSTTIKGNRITDFADTTATVGVPIPFGHGRFPTDGNVIWAALPPKEHRSRQRQGKGGVKQEVYTYTLSYAIAFALGPIYGFWWIKRNGKVVYTQDPNAPVEDREYAAKWLQKATLHLGGPQQMPDSTIESYEGTGQVSAFRHLAYIVVEDDDVTDGGGAVPSYEACVIATPPEAYLTSRPYEQMVEDAAHVDVSLADGVLRTIMHETYLPPEPVAVSAELRGGYLGLFLISQVVSEKTPYDVTLLGGTLKVAQVETQLDPERTPYTATLVGGELKRQLVVYDPALPEQVVYNVTLIGGTLG